MAWWEPTTGSYTAVAAYRAIGAASLADSYINLVDPGTNDAAPGVAPSFATATGWTFNGTSQYLTTGISAGQNWTAIIRFSDGALEGGSGSYKIIFGTDSSTNRRFYIWPYFSATQYVVGGGGFVINTYGSALFEGVLAIAGRQGYVNGAAHGSETNAAYSGDAQWPLLIGAVAQASDGGPNTSFMWNGKVQAVAIYSTTLDATQVAEISANMAALAVATVYEQAVAGTLTSAGTLVKRTSKPLAGTLTSAGTVVKSTGKVLAGALTSAGAVVKATGKTLAGTLTSAGTLATVFVAAAQGLIDLTARARSFALQAKERVFALTARSRE